MVVLEGGALDICINVIKRLWYGRGVPFDNIGPDIPHQPSGQYGIPGPI